MCARSCRDPFVGRSTLRAGRSKEPVVVVGNLGPGRARGVVVLRVVRVVRRERSWQRSKSWYMVRELFGLGSREDEGAARRHGHRYTAPRWCVSLWIMLRPAGNRAEREPTSGTPPAAHPHTDRLSLPRRHPNPTLDSRPQRWRRRAGVRRERDPREGPDGSSARVSGGDPRLMRSTRLYSHAPRVCDVWDPRPRTRGGAPPRPRGAAVLEERSQAKCTHKDSERPRIQRLGYREWESSSYILARR